MNLGPVEILIILAVAGIVVLVVIALLLYIANQLRQR